VTRAFLLAALITVPANVGYVAVFGLIMVETMGVPVPGETALVAAALLAHDGQLDIFALVALASAAAIIGDNVGYVIGRKGGRSLIERPGPFHAQRLRALALGGPFFERHGPKAVFLARWVSGLRIAGAWLAGINHMHWATFARWNALGGIAWACGVGFAVYFAGHAAERVLTVAGPAALALAIVAVVALLVWHRTRERRREAAALEDAPATDPQPS
jgi:membrane-associated protein